MASIALGDINPGGKLPITFPKTVGQIPFNFPYKPASQADEPTRINGHLFCFGYGLSYTTFSYSNLVITPTRQSTRADIKISVDVTNTWARDGDEVV